MCALRMGDWQYWVKRENMLCKSNSNLEWPFARIKSKVIRFADNWFCCHIALCSLLAHTHIRLAQHINISSQPASNRGSGKNHSFTAHLCLPHTHTHKHPTHHSNRPKAMQAKNNKRNTSRKLDTGKKAHNVEKQKVHPLSYILIFTCCVIAIGSFALCIEHIVLERDK